MTSADQSSRNYLKASDAQTASRQSQKLLFVRATAAVLACLLGLVGFASQAAAEQDLDTDYTALIGGHEFEARAADPAASSCAAGDSNQRIIYTLARGVPVTGGGLSAGTSRIRCGSSSWGLRHIDIQHSGQWGTIASRVGGGWEEFMAWAVGEILRVPERATYRASNDTWGYTAPLVILDSDGNVVGEYNPLVAVAAGSGNVITAYPRS